MKNFLIILILTFSISFLEASIDSLDNKNDTTKGLPLEPGRKININTTEGTWMSLDVSPDGKNHYF